MVRRGRKPKAAENEELLNFEPATSSPGEEAGAEAAGNGNGGIESWDGPPGSGEGELLDEDGGEKNGGRAVIVRSRTRRTAPRQETRGRYGRGPGSNPAPSGAASFGSAAGSSGSYPGNNGGASSAPPPGIAAAGREDAQGTPLPALPVRLPSMPDIYGRPEPRLDQDNGKPRLTINELIRLNMIDLRELAVCYNISHDDMVALKKQEIIFSILKAHTERGGIIYAYG
ncbi:MAG: Rho termination factor N-terminal domain-containing protein, partial [Treponema sp.]|nr:Rho termination factor N-terminal domain-containing protein [Treponema sp.]